MGGGAVRVGFSAPGAELASPVWRKCAGPQPELPRRPDLGLLTQKGSMSAMIQYTATVKMPTLDRDASLTFLSRCNHIIPVNSEWTTNPESGCFPNSVCLVAYIDEWFT